MIGVPLGLYFAPQGGRLRSRPVRITFPWHRTTFQTLRLSLVLAYRRSGERSALLERLDATRLLTVHGHLPVGSQLILMQLRPGLHETQLSSRQLAVHWFQGFAGERRRALV